MNKYDNIAISICVASSVIAVAYFIFGLWFLSWIEGYRDRDVLRHETCYQEFSISNGEVWLSKAYCGRGQ